MRAIYDEVVLIVAQGLRADRVAIVYRDAEGVLALGGSYGFAQFNLIDPPISQSVLREVIDTDRTIVSSDAKRDFQSRNDPNLRLSGAVSFLCIPFYNAAGRPVGALYADTLKRPGAFHRSEIFYARDCASWLECCLAGRDNVPRPEIDEPDLSPPRRPAAVPTPKVRQVSRDPHSTLGVSSQGLVVYFRSLATLTQAGVMIHEGLAALARTSSEKNLQTVLAGLSQAVGRGEPLSKAMERYPNTFSAYLSSAVRVGENTGRLVHVLEVVSRDLEKGQRLTYRLRSALAYPLMLSLACGLLMLFGPPYLLAGQLKILSESGVPLPFLTQALMLISSLTGHPAFVVFFILALAALVRWALTAGGRQTLWLWAGRLPVLRRIVRTTALARVSRSLSLQLKSGMTALDALVQARTASSDPQLAAALLQAESGLRNGCTLTEAFASSGFFSPVYLSFLEAGENSGSLVKLIDWLADFYERELEDDLDRFVSMAEPVLMLVMGLVTMLILVATLRPTIAILQTL